MISVIMSVYNDELYLRECLESLAKQTYTVFEVIIVDDCSTDGSTVIIRDFCEADHRFRAYTNKENRGLPYSLNKAISYSTHSLIARMDGDDVAKPNRLSCQLHFLNCNPHIDIVGSNADLIGPDSKVIGVTNMPTDHAEIIEKFKWVNPIVHPSVMMRKEVLLTLCSYNDALLRAQDLDLWYRAADAGFKFANISEPLMSYRVKRSNSLSSAFRGFSVEVTRAIETKSGRRLLFAGLILVRNVLVKFHLYRPRSIRRNRK